jgi:hypothetical protein
MAHRDLLLDCRLGLHFLGKRTAHGSCSDYALQPSNHHLHAGMRKTSSGERLQPPMMHLVEELEMRAVTFLRTNE